jgi:hypothetical protein
VGGSNVVLILVDRSSSGLSAASKCLPRHAIAELSPIRCTPIPWWRGTEFSRLGWRSAAMAPNGKASNLEIVGLFVQRCIRASMPLLRTIAENSDRRVARSLIALSR